MFAAWGKDNSPNLEQVIESEELNLTFFFYLNEFIDKKKADVFPVSQSLTLSKVI